MIVVCFISFLSINTADAATTYKDGEYSLPVTVLQGDNNERSKTNDYIVSPAKLIVNNGQNTVQLTLKNSSWWKSFSVSTGSVTTISESNDTRVVQFPVQDLNEIVHANIHIVVPDIDYDNKYNVRFKFDPSGIPKSGGDSSSIGNEEKTTENENSSNDGESGTKKAEENPPTGDDAPIVLLTIILLSSGLLLVRQFATR